jgi:plastocyanin
MNDMGNSSGVSVAHHMVFATAQADGGSTLFALKLGATGDQDGGDDSGGGGGGGGDQPPSDDGGGSSDATVVTGPGAQNYGYLTPAVTVSKGGKLSYFNGDAVKHNVSSPDGLFHSELADTNTTVPVDGVEKLAPGKYPFICQPHPNMKGTLTVK